MERLTTKVDNLYQTNDKFTPLLGIKRLGEYEDTGLTPEEINGFKHLEVILHTAIDKLTENVKSEAIKEFAERLKEYELCMFCSFPDNKSLGSEQYIVLSDSIDTLVKEMTEEKPMNNWISVKDRLPKPHDRVLCYFKFEPESPDVIGENTYIGNKIWMSESTKVTHWMPLPEPPKGE